MASYFDGFLSGKQSSSDPNPQFITIEQLKRYLATDNNGIGLAEEDYKRILSNVLQNKLRQMKDRRKKTGAYVDNK
jgi:hypothetical protein